MKKTARCRGRACSGLVRPVARRCHGHVTPKSLGSTSTSAAPPSPGRACTDVAEEVYRSRVLAFPEQDTKLSTREGVRLDADQIRETRQRTPNLHPHVDCDAIGSQDSRRRSTAGDRQTSLSVMSLRERQRARHGSARERRDAAFRRREESRPRPRQVSMQTEGGTATGDRSADRLTVSSRVSGTRTQCCWIPTTLLPRSQ